MDAVQLKRIFLRAVSALTSLALAAPAHGAASASIAVGARIPGTPANPALIDAYARAVGRTPAIVSYYREWGESVFDRPSLGAVTRHGAVAMITWEPTVRDWVRGRTSTILSTIAGGRADGYIRSVARSVPRSPPLIFLRFAPEMNGGWNPWGVRVPGNSARLYVAAWRHVVEIFRAAHVRNVRWVWCPNVDDYGKLPFVAAYPGDRWVDWVGLDGYNWGGNYDWQSFTAIFASSYDRLGRLTRRPLMIAETGSGEAGGSKAAWIRNTFDRELPRFTRIAALVWFNGPGETGADFRFNSSPAAARAFRAALRSPRYAATGSTLLKAVVARRPFAPIRSPAPPKHGIPRVVDYARRRWWIAAGVAVALLSMAWLITRRRLKNAHPAP